VQVIVGNCFDNIKIKSIIEATGVSLNNSNLSFTALNATQTLTATPTPSNTTDTVTWKSSNTAIATVSSTGVVTSKSDGTCTITATCGSKSATCSVTVSSMQITPIQNKINVDTTNGDVRLDMKEYFTFKGISQNDATWTLEKITGNIGTLNSERILAISHNTEATANVKVTYGNITATINVVATVTVIKCTSISVSPTSMTVNEGDFVAFYSDISVSVQPSNCTQSVTFGTGNSDVMSPSIAAEGVYQALGEGTTTLTAYCGEQWANCRVTVNAATISCEAIRLSADVATISVDGYVDLNAYIEPTNCTEEITWTSLSPGVATVNKYGTVTGKSSGTCTIKATCGGKSATCTVTVN
jgi:uncharacterized protein YjdB